MPLAIGFPLVADQAERAGWRARREVAGEVVLTLGSVLRKKSGSSTDPFTKCCLVFNSH